MARASDMRVPFTKLSAKTEGQRQLLQSIYNNDITVTWGPAGTGKTCTALSAALELFNQHVVRQIIVIRRMTQIFDEDIGALPGDSNEKFVPYAGPVWDAMVQMMEPPVLEKFIKDKFLQILPVSWVRGRTFVDSFILVDEAQQMSDEMILCVLTRLGQRSKMVIAGDPQQSDISGVNGLIMARQVTQDLEGVGHVQLNSRQIVRHPLVQSIVERAYEIKGVNPLG